MSLLRINFYFHVPQRWIIIGICILGLFNSFTMRLCLSIAITEIVPANNRMIETTDDICPRTDQVISSSNDTDTTIRRFDWDEKTQGLILSSIYWGYIVTSLLSGTILKKLGAKRSMGLSVLSISIFTLLTPSVIELGGSTRLIFLRILIGLGEGAIQPAIMRLMARWIPEDERSWAAAWAFSGMSLGTVIGMAGSGSIIQRSNIGWPAAFYFYGAIGILSFFIHCGLCYNSPNEHPFISVTEKSYLTEKLKHTHKELPSTPWKYLAQYTARSKPFWALQIGLVGKGWCLFMLVSDMPKYMSSVLKFSVEANGYVTSIPYLCSWIFNCASSRIADHVIAKNFASTGCVRKIGNTISIVVTGLFLITATYVGCDRVVVVVLHIFAMMMFNCANFGTMVNALDLAPNYAGAIQGVLFGFSGVAGFLSPCVVGLLAPNQTISEWRLVFWLLFAICTLTNVIFVLYGSGEVQEWNEPNFLVRTKRADDEDEVDPLLDKC